MEDQRANIMSRPLTPLMHLPSFSSGLDATNSLTDSIASDPQVIELLRRLGKLSRRTRQVFLLSRLDDCSYSQIATFLEIDPQKVERAMERVMRHAAGHESREQNPVQAQAHQWYVHLQSPAATASQRIEFRHWLDADPAHLQAFQVSERLWRQLRAPAAMLGASGWHRRKRRHRLVWFLTAAFVCGLMMTAEAFS
jgi:hypothetical protein